MPTFLIDAEVGPTPYLTECVPGTFVSTLYKLIHKILIATLLRYEIGSFIPSLQMRKLRPGKTWSHEQADCDIMVPGSGLL